MLLKGTLKNRGSFTIMHNKTQVVVVGAGHTGIEAAPPVPGSALTPYFSLSRFACQHACNPSIGGTGKGHLVYEIDALGGEMGRAADRVTLQSRT